MRTAPHGTHLQNQRTFGAYVLPARYCADDVAGQRRGFQALSDVWDVLGDTSFEFPEIRDAGDRVVALARFSGTVASSPSSKVGPASLAFGPGRAAPVA